jgi:hypothetical protein
MGGPSGTSRPAPEGGSRRNSGNNHGAANEPNNRSGGSSPNDGQASDDDYVPVIVDGSTTSKKGKQPVPTAPLPAPTAPLPDADATRFIRIERMQLDDWHPQMLVGRIKALVSTHSILELTA